MISGDVLGADDPSELSNQITAPGILKIFGNEICEGAHYKSVLATTHSSAKELVKEALERWDHVVSVYMCVSACHMCLLCIWDLVCLHRVSYFFCPSTCFFGCERCYMCYRICIKAVELSLHTKLWQLMKKGHIHVVCDWFILDGQSWQAVLFCLLLLHYSAHSVRMCVNSSFWSSEKV